MNTRYIGILVLVLLGLALLIISIIYTGENGKTFKESKVSENFSFDLKNNYEIIKLPGELNEISALAFYGDGKLICLHDEKGDFFLINYQNGSIEKKYSLVGHGDFEGLEIMNQTVYFLKSNGMIIKIEHPGKDSMEISKIKTGLSSKNDCEGLTYDPLSEKLLIACKNKAKIHGSKQEFKNKRAIYEFDFLKEQLTNDPKYLIDIKEVETKTGRNHFMPSGIAVHPGTNDIYIIASSGKLLIVLNREGEIISFTHLDPHLFNQPEGICFNREGNKLFISNENKFLGGNILIFNQISNEKEEFID